MTLQNKTEVKTADKYVNLRKTIINQATEKFTFHFFAHGYNLKMLQSQNFYFMIKF